jgi:nucleoside-diphosphate-sugar epimerase
MITLVTGAAGFIGSHLCEHLLAAGDAVRGLDAFVDYYSRSDKERNLANINGHSRFSFVEGDLSEMWLEPLLDRVDVVYHLAGQPGVRASWGVDFDLYVRHNLLATQRLLEECHRRPLVKFVYASSSSVYGDAPRFPVSESAGTCPVSPYGVTKLAAEHLCRTYEVTSQLPVACLRLFSVYGPRQRPDMAFARLITAAVHGGTFELYGNGEQTRDWTYVKDVVSAMRDAAVSEWSGVANIGGGARISMNEVVEAVSRLYGTFELVRVGKRRGDVRHTGADTTMASAGFGYRPETNLRDGLHAMIDWERSRKTAPV